VVVENAGHGFSHGRDVPICPSREEVIAMMVEFFDQYLK